MSVKFKSNAVFLEEIKLFYDSFRQLSYTPGGRKDDYEALKGQPAGQGIARGNTRVVLNTADLFSFKSGEILVCDVVD